MTKEMDIVPQKQRVAIVTGGANGIGRAIASEFRKAGCAVCVIDKQPNDYFTGDLADEETLEIFVQKVIKDYGMWTI